MSSYPRPATHHHKAPNQKKCRKRQQKYSGRDYALLVGEVISEKLKAVIVNGKRLMSNREIEKSLKITLRECALLNCSVEVVKGEVHAYIGSLADHFHGHVIVPFRTLMMRYCRGYGEPRGAWNHIRA